jgi:hypothetical protein
VFELITVVFIIVRFSAASCSTFWFNLWQKVSSQRKLTGNKIYQKLISSVTEAAVRSETEGHLSVEGT